VMEPEETCVCVCMYVCMYLCMYVCLCTWHMSEETSRPSSEAVGANIRRRCETVMEPEHMYVCMYVCTSVSVLDT
jgi:hypothetical protein